jgi:hypothetical protein
LEPNPAALLRASIVIKPSMQRLKQDEEKSLRFFMASATERVFEFGLAVLVAWATKLANISPHRRVHISSCDLALLSAITPCTPPAQATNETNNAF